MSVRRAEPADPGAKPELTKAQTEYLLKARRGVLALGNARQMTMQRKLEAGGLIVRDHYGYFVLTDAGAAALGPWRS